MKNRQKSGVVSSDDEEPGRMLLSMQWGLVPSWHKGDPKDFNFNMINCRSDTLMEKKSFQKALEKGQRCVVLCDGFYEWHTGKDKDKQPYYIQLKDSMNAPQVENEENRYPDATASKEQGSDVASSEKQKPMVKMAGLFDRQMSEQHGELYTYTVITVAASQSFSWLHHRMPAILDSEDAVEKWLDVDTVKGSEALKLLVPTDCLSWYPVSSHVNNVRNDSAQCTKKIDLAKQSAAKKKSSNLMSMWLSKGEKRKGEPNVEGSAKKLK